MYSWGWHISKNCGNCLYIFNYYGLGVWLSTRTQNLSFINTGWSEVIVEIFFVKAHHSKIIYKIFLYFVNITGRKSMR